MAKKLGRPLVDLDENIRNILSHTDALGLDSLSPITHYRRAVNANFVMIRYIERHLSKRPLYPANKAKHMGHLRRFVLANLIETFERFVKELAAVCIDQLASFVTDDRYNEFSAKGNDMIAHFEAGSIGKALCESDTWLSNDVINRRFRKLLAPPDKDHWDEFLLPGKSQGKGGSREAREAQEKRSVTLAILWQIRHNVTHNSGVLTGSDTMKLRVLTRRHVESARVLIPTEEDLRSVKRFLTETADEINSRVGARLAELLTHVYKESSTFIDPKSKAQELANLFDMSVRVATAQGDPIVYD